jgi:hypothetical protein
VVGKRIEGAVPFYGTFLNASDERAKTEIEQVTKVLEKLKNLRGVAFTWRDSPEAAGGTPGSRSIGVIAQEVGAAFPELVSDFGRHNYKAVNYSGLTAVLVEAVKELDSARTVLADRITRLENSPAPPGDL